jgi:hypothetical protein
MKFTYFFLPSPDRKDFVLEMDCADQYLKKPCFIVRGKVDYYSKAPEPRSEYIRRFLEIGVYNILLANMAKHPQYSAEEFNSFANNPYHYIRSREYDLLCKENILSILDEREKKLIRMQKLSERLGCCLDNQALLFVAHVFCDILENQVGFNCLKLGIKGVVKSVAKDLDLEKNCV